jgi:exodeoxyribonuclease VII large subunit
LEDLWAFNEEIVVRAIYHSRLPVVSAVGHEIDVTLSDLVADVRALTPSEAAERIAPATDDLLAHLGQQQSRLIQALRAKASASKATVDRLAAARCFRRPLERIQNLSQILDELGARANRSMSSRLRQARALVDSRTAQLESLSPLGVLARGYSLTQRAADGRLLRRASEVSLGDQIHTRLADGEIVSRVEKLQNNQ